MKNQYFQPRALPKRPATFPELPGSAREPPGAAEMLFGGLSSARAPARAETGRPQNWSPAISGSPKPLKINEKSLFSAQNPSKTLCNHPRAFWKPQTASWSRPNAPWRFLRRPSARARGVWLASKLVPGDFWQPKTIKINEKSKLSAQKPSETFCNLPRALWKRHRASWSRPNASWRTLQRRGVLSPDN